MIKPYFSHDYYSRTNPKLIKLQIKLGHAGKGIFWDLIEILHEENGFIKISDIELISYQIRADIEIIKSIFFDFDLFENDSQKIWSNSALKRIEKQKQKSEILSKNGKKGGRPKANEKQMLSGAKANEKQKESKEEKEVNELNEQIKENINKNKDKYKVKETGSFSPNNSRTIPDLTILPEMQDINNKAEVEVKSVFDFYNMQAEIFPDKLRKSIALIDKARQNLKTLIINNKFNRQLFFQKLNTGGIDKWNNAPIDFNFWFSNTDNYLKLINGNYDIKNFNNKPAEQKSEFENFDESKYKIKYPESDGAGALKFAELSTDENGNPVLLYFSNENRVHKLKKVYPYDADKNSKYQIILNNILRAPKNIDGKAGYNYYV